MIKTMSNIGNYIKSEKFDIFSGDNFDILNEDRKSELNFYIGRVGINGKGIYSKNFFEQSFLELLRNGYTNINIILGSELTKKFNFNNNEFLETLEEERKIIEEIFSSNKFSKFNFKYKITSLKNDRNSEFIESFDDEYGYQRELNDFYLNSELSAEYIYICLYIFSQSDNNFFKNLVKISDGKNNKTNGNFDEKRKNRKYYYSIAEVAVRIMDLINGKNIQGGEIGQIRFDSIITFIIDYKGKNSILIDLSKKINQKLKENNIDFKKFYLNKSELQKSEDNRIKNRKIRNRICTTVTAVSLLLGTGSYIKNQQDQIEQQSFDSKINTLVLDNYPNIEKYHDNWMYSYLFDIEGYDIDNVKSQVSNLTNTFISLYGDYKSNNNSKKYEEIYFLILNDFLQKDNTFFKDKKGHIFDWSSQYLDFFKDKYKTKLLQLKFDLDNNILTNNSTIINNSIGLNDSESKRLDGLIKQDEVEVLGTISINYSEYEIGKISIIQNTFLVSRYIRNYKIKDALINFQLNNYRTDILTDNFKYYINEDKFSLEQTKNLGEDLLKYL